MRRYNIDNDADQPAVPWSIYVIRVAWPAPELNEHQVKQSDQTNQGRVRVVQQPPLLHTDHIRSIAAPSCRMMRFLRG
jgi:hypothetical protein